MRRDNRVDFFHVVGKLLYPAKREERIFDENIFWDIDLNTLLSYLSHYCPKFYYDVAKISAVLSEFSRFDIIPWHVKVYFKRKALLIYCV